MFRSRIKQCELKNQLTISAVRIFADPFTRSRGIIYKSASSSTRGETIGHVLRRFSTNIGDKHFLQFRETRLIATISINRRVREYIGAISSRTFISIMQLSMISYRSWHRVYFLSLNWLHSSKNCMYINAWEFRMYTSTLQCICTFLEIVQSAQ